MIGVLSQFSPLTRKILALGLLVLALLLVWTLMLSPVAAQMENSLTELEDARFQRERLEKLQVRPQPEKAEALPANIVFISDSREEAAVGLSNYISSLAAQNDLQVANITAHPGGKTDKLLISDFALIGEEGSVARFINQAERGAPIIRFRSWQIEAGNANDPSLQFSGQAVAAWIKP